MTGTLLPHKMGSRQDLIGARLGVWESCMLTEQPSQAGWWVQL